MSKNAESIKRSELQAKIDAELSDLQSLPFISQAEKFESVVRELESELG